MLHLIWTKDNNTIGEDGKELKGIRQKVLEVYRNLYFDPRADLEPRKQVNFIAQQMVMCVARITFTFEHNILMVIQVNI